MYNKDCEGGKKYEEYFILNKCTIIIDSRMYHMNNVYDKIIGLNRIVVLFFMLGYASC